MDEKIQKKQKKKRYYKCNKCYRADLNRARMKKHREVCTGENQKICEWNQ